MKHATGATLAQIESLLLQLRQFEPLREKKFGIFYRGAVAFLHFHEDDSSIFADLKTGIQFSRFSVTSQAEQERLLAQVRKTFHLATRL
jgi:hypothetical protein